MIVQENSFYAIKNLSDGSGVNNNDLTWVLLFLQMGVHSLIVETELVANDSPMYAFKMN